LCDGFATLFLNRVNFSGIINGGPIGGLTQTGTHKVDCRFNKEDIKSEIEVVAKLKRKIKLYNKDAGYLITENLVETETPGRRQLLLPDNDNYFCRFVSLSVTLPLWM
jgi:DNA adenine methylase